MTPKEKAEELTIKAAEHTDIHNNIGAVDHDLWDKRNRQIALIVVE